MIFIIIIISVLLIFTIKLIRDGYLLDCQQKKLEKQKSKFKQKKSKVKVK